jgi:hypothetical protein
VTPPAADDDRPVSTTSRKQLKLLGVMMTTRTSARGSSARNRATTLDEPFGAFPSWFMRITCDRCCKDRMLNEAYTAHRDLPIRTILDRMRHDGCGGRAGRVELLTGIEGASSRPVRKILLVRDT